MNLRFDGGPVVVSALAAVLLALLSGCTGGSRPAADPGKQPSASPTLSVLAPSTEGSAAMEGMPPEPPFTEPTVIASGSGTLQDYRPAVPATLGINSLIVTASNTLLRFQITTSQETNLGNLGPKNSFELSGQYAETAFSGVTLTDPATGSVFHVPCYRADYFPVLHCASTQLPRKLDSAPRYGYTAYAPLPQGVTSVIVTVPGIEPITVPVTRS